MIFLYFFIFLSIFVGAQVQASQVAQPTLKKQRGYKKATPLELQMFEEASLGLLTEKTLQQYLKSGADIDAKADRGNTALISASFNGHAAVVQLLIAAGADIDAKNYCGNTALQDASYKNHPAIVQLLILADADVNAKSLAGHTPLIDASRCGSTTIVQQFIAAGADHTIVNEYNETARDYASDKDAYDKAVAAGLQERKEYLDRQPIAKTMIAEHMTHIPDLQNIIMSYAYGPSPLDLPPAQTQEEEKKSDDSAKK